MTDVISLILLIKNSRRFIMYIYYLFILYIMPNNFKIPFFCVSQSNFCPYFLHRFVRINEKKHKEILCPLFTSLNRLTIRLDFGKKSCGDLIRINTFLTANLLSPLSIKSLPNTKLARASHHR